MELLLNVLSALLCGFILVITLASHLILKRNDMKTIKARIRHMGRDTVGQKVYRWTLVLATVLGFWYGVSPGIGALLFTAVLAERLMIYRICRPYDAIGRFLTRIDW